MASTLLFLSSSESGVMLSTSTVTGFQGVDIRKLCRSASDTSYHDPSFLSSSRAAGDGNSVDASTVL